MSAILEPKPGFDWSKLTWGRPDSPRSALCSYCFAILPEDSFTLTMWTNDGHAANFCADCQKAWFGMESFDDDAGDD